MQRGAEPATRMRERKLCTFIYQIPQVLLNMDNSVSSRMALRIPPSATVDDVIQMALNKLPYFSSTCDDPCLILKGSTTSPDAWKFLDPLEGWESVCGLGYSEFELVSRRSLILYVGHLFIPAALPQDRWAETEKYIAAVIGDGKYPRSDDKTASHREYVFDESPLLLFPRLLSRLLSLYPLEYSFASQSSVFLRSPFSGECAIVRLVDTPNCVLSISVISRETRRLMAFLALTMDSLFHSFVPRGVFSVHIPCPVCRTHRFSLASILNHLSVLSESLSLSCPHCKGTYLLSDLAPDVAFCDTRWILPAEIARGDLIGLCRCLCLSFDLLKFFTRRKRWLRKGVQRRTQRRH
jgi:hypothetical protein